MQDFHFEHLLLTLHYKPFPQELRTADNTETERKVEQ